MAFKTLSEIRLDVRRKADIENDGNHITDSEIDTYINTSISKLFSQLVDGTDGSLFAKNAPVLPVLGEFSYRLPSDFSRLVSVDVKVNGHYVRSTAADPQDYAELSLLQSNGLYASPRRHYLRWNIEQGRAELFLFPKVTTASDLAVLYVPNAPQLSLDSDPLNLPDFWYEWVVLDSGIYCMLKEESDPSGLMAERQKVETRLRDHVRAMTVTEFKTIRKARWNWRY